MNMNHECPICNDLLKELSDLRRAVQEMSATASATYNDKRVSVDKKKMRKARDMAMAPIANLDHSMKGRTMTTDELRAACEAAAKEIYDQLEHDSGAALVFSTGWIVEIIENHLSPLLTPEREYLTKTADALPREGTDHE